MGKLILDESLGGELFDRIQGFVEESDGPDYRDVLETILLELLDEETIRRVEVGLVRRGLLRRDEEKDYGYKSDRSDDDEILIPMEDDICQEPDQDTGTPDFLVTDDRSFDDGEDEIPDVWNEYPAVSHDGKSFVEVEPLVHRRVFGDKRTPVPAALYYCDNRFCPCFRSDRDAFEVRGVVERLKSCGATIEFTLDAPTRVVRCSECKRQAKINTMVFEERRRRQPKDRVMYCENLGCEYYLRWDNKFVLEVGKATQVGAGFISDSSNVEVRVGTSEGFIRAKCCHCGKHTMSKIVREIAQKQGGQS